MRKERAEYCVEWLQAQGIEEVLSDECTNVIVPWNIQSGKNNCMFMAHLDTVFSEETELMIKEKKRGSGVVRELEMILQMPQYYCC